MRLAGAPVVAFLATADVARCRAFYEGVLGLALAEDSPFAVVFDAADTMLRIQKVASFTPQPFTALGWRTDDIAATVAELGAAGVTFERYPQLEQDAAGIWTSPGGARIAWFRDPDGNVLSLTQFG